MESREREYHFISYSSRCFVCQGKISDFYSQYKVILEAIPMEMHCMVMCLSSYSPMWEKIQKVVSTEESIVAPENKTKTMSSPRKDIVYYSCNEIGHIASHWPNNSDDNNMSETSVSSTGEKRCIPRCGEERRSFDDSRHSEVT
jgi:Abl-interactor HHR